MASTMSLRVARGSVFVTQSAMTARLLRQNTLRYHPLAILASQRYRLIGTETSAGGHNGGPPPGFNLKEAQKPLPREKAPAKPAQVKSIKSDTAELQTKPKAQLLDPTVVPPRPDIELHKEIELAAQKEKEAKAEKATKEVEKKKEEEKKLTVWQKVKKEAAHYWDGTKLLGMEMKISFKLALKMAGGYELTRRENRQLQRTVQDMSRLVPFSVFVIVPFAELLLPVAIKLFPNLLPSTYEGAKDRERKNALLRDTRKQVSDFLKTTLKETGLPLSKKTRSREEFTEFFKKVRSSGESPSHEDVIAVCKVFKDDLTLDNLSRPQLVGMCRYMNLNSFGTDMILRYTIRHRMRQIKRDDRSIWIEGVESLSVPELQTACASRGMRTHGISPARLRDDMQTWLDLRLKHNIPSTLLVLSNAFMYTQGKDGQIDSHYDALEAVLSSIPEELYHEIELEVDTAEGAATNKQRLSVLKEQQMLIEEENTQGVTEGTVSSKLDKDIDEKEERKAEAAGETEEGSQKEAAEETKKDKDLEKAMKSHEGETQPIKVEMEGNLEDTMKEVERIEKEAKEAKESKETKEKK